MQKVLLKELLIDQETRISQGSVRWNRVGKLLHQDNIYEAESEHGSDRRDACRC